MGAPEKSSHSSHGAAALVATSLGFSVVQLDVSVVNVAIRSIGDDLGGSIDDLQWVVNAYTIAFAALILSAGALGDRIGARRVFIGGFACFAVASVACGSAPTLGFLIAARGVQGVGAAVLVPCSLSLLSHAYADRAARARAIGLWAAGASTALSAGPLIGGLLIAWVDWRAIFFINVPLAAIAMLLTVRYTHETTRSPERGVDPIGQALAIAALTSLAAAMVEGGSAGFASRWVLAAFAIAVLAGGLFVAAERRTRQPLLPLRLFASATFRTTTIIGLAINVAFYGLIFVLSLYFQTTLRYSPLVTGLAFAPSTVAVLGANVASSRLTHRFGIRPILVVAFALMAASLLGLLGLGGDTHYAEMVGQLVLLGIGLGLVVPAITAALLGSAELSRSGVASGTFNTARQCGSVVGVSLFGALAAGSLVSGLHVDLVIAAALAVGCLGLALGLQSSD